MDHAHACRSVEELHHLAVLLPQREAITRRRERARSILRHEPDRRLGESRLRLRLGFRLGLASPPAAAPTSRRHAAATAECSRAAWGGYPRAHVATTTALRATACGGRSSASRAGGHCRSSSCRSRAGRPSARTSCPRGTGGGRRLRASRGRCRARRRSSSRPARTGRRASPARRRRACSPTQSWPAGVWLNET